MTFPYDEWDEYLSDRFQPIRNEVIGVTVGALPQEAGKFSDLEYEFMDFFFPSYTGLEKQIKSKSQKVRMTLMVRLFFDKRYSDDINVNKKVLEWVETSVIGLLVGHRLPKTASELTIETGRLFPPDAGKWYKELTFSFEAWANPKEMPEPIKPLVTHIIAKNDMDILAEIKKNAIR